MAALADQLPARDLSIVCLPDLFLDHMIAMPPIGEAEHTLRDVHDQGGGKVLDVPQQVVPGGNAANTAHALARLGADVQLAGRTSPRGRSFFAATIGTDGVDMGLVRDDGELAATAVLAYEPEGTNVMLNDPGSVETYGPDDVTARLAEAIGEADAVLVGNWAIMTEHGSELVAHVSELAGPDTLTYLDAADPARRDDEDELVDQLASIDWDVWTMNEAEAELFSGQTDMATAADVLAEETGARVDVHSGERAVSCASGVQAEAACYDVEPEHLTGAGDAFNAGNLIADLLGADPETRLRFAHAVAAATIADPDARPPDPAGLQELQATAEAQHRSAK
jgi:fructokinase